MYGLTAAIATQHGKADYIAKPLAAALGWQVVNYTGFNTDTLGTFSGEVARTQSPYECAKHKALMSLQHHDAELGIGSEGSFQSDGFGLFALNTEILVCVNRDGKVIASASAQQPIMLEKLTLALPLDVNWKSQVSTFIEEVPPGQAGMIIARDSKKSALAAHKGLLNAAAIELAVQQLGTTAKASLIELQYDFRAMHCPQRQVTLELAAQALVKYLTSHCPQCAARGFVVKQRVAGLPCRQCGTPSRQPKAHVMTCQDCGFSQTQAVEAPDTDPVNCNYCNP